MAGRFGSVADDVGAGEDRQVAKNGPLITDGLIKWPFLRAMRRPSKTQPKARGQLHATRVQPKNAAKLD